MFPVNSVFHIGNAIQLVSAQVIAVNFCQPTLEDVQAIVAKYLSNKNADIFFNKNGHDNYIAEIDDQWIVRFPRSAKIWEDVKREHKLLQSLHSLALINVPNYSIISENPHFVIYQKIPGNVLSKELYESLSDSQKDMLAFSIGSFLVNLHQFPIGKAKEIGYFIEKIDLKKLKHNIFCRLQNTALEDFFTYLTNKYSEKAKFHQTYVLTHDNFHGNNLLVDEEGVLRGIIDFTDAKIGTPIRDFDKLAEVSDDLVRRVVLKYSEATGVENFYEEVTLYQGIRRFNSLANALDENDSLRIERCCNRLMILRDVVL